MTSSSSRQRDKLTRRSRDDRRRRSGSSSASNSNARSLTNNSNGEDTDDPRRSLDRASPAAEVRSGGRSKRAGIRIRINGREIYNRRNEEAYNNRKQTKKRKKRNRFRNNNNNNNNKEATNEADNQLESCKSTHAEKKKLDDTTTTKPTSLLSLTNGVGSQLLPRQAQHLEAAQQGSRKSLGALEKDAEVTKCKETSNHNQAPINQHDELEQKRLIRDISEQILLNSKSSGLFDELRMSLLHKIESSDRFKLLTDEFKRELAKFCYKSADLSLPRARLREQLNERNLTESSYKLTKLVGEVARQEKHELRRLYRQQANDWLLNRTSSQLETAEVTTNTISSDSTIMTSHTSPNAINYLQQALTTTTTMNRTGPRPSDQSIS